MCRDRSGLVGAARRGSCGLIPRDRSRLLDVRNVLMARERYARTELPFTPRNVQRYCAKGHTHTLGLPPH